MRPIGIRNRLARIVRGIFPASAPPQARIDYLDAPVVTAFSDAIPCGDILLPVANYVPAIERAEVEPVPLGAATIAGRNGQIRQRGIWLREFSWHAGHSFLSPSYHISPAQEALDAPVEHIEGRTTATLSSFSFAVYGHALLDELPMLLHLLDSGRYRGVDTILASALAIKLLGRCAHAEMADFVDRLRPADIEKRYACAAFTAFRRTGCGKNPSRQELDLLRRMAALGPARPEDPRRVYFRRSTAHRRVENAVDLERLLSRHGFGIVDATSLENPWRICAHAECVAGIAGSDLSDSCFMAEGATLLEIHPSDHVQPYNLNVARKLGLSYHGVLARSQTERGSPLQPGNSPITVDLDTLEHWLIERFGAAEG